MSHTPGKKDMPLLLPYLAQSPVYGAPVSAPWGSRMIGRAPAQHTPATHLHPLSLGLSLADVAQPHASQQDNLKIQVGQRRTF